MSLEAALRGRLRHVAGRAQEGVQTWARDLANAFTREDLAALIDRELHALCPPPSHARPSPVALLNVGAGGALGGRVERLRDHATVTTIDVDAGRGPDLVADVCALPFEDARFDVAAMFEVLEHVSDPQRALDELHRVLRPGGRLVLSTPWSLEIHDAPHDYYRFTAHGLRHLLRAFEDVEILPRSGYVYAALAPWVRLHRSPHRADAALGYALLAAVGVGKPLLDWLDARIAWDALTAGYLGRARKG